MQIQVAEVFGSNVNLKATDKYDSKRILSEENLIPY